MSSDFGSVVAVVNRSSKGNQYLFVLPSDMSEADVFDTIAEILQRVHNDSFDLDGRRLHHTGGGDPIVHIVQSGGTALGVVVRGCGRCVAVPSNARVDVRLHGDKARNGEVDIDIDDPLRGVRVAWRRGRLVDKAIGYSWFDMARLYDSFVSRDGYASFDFDPTESVWIESESRV